MILQDIDNLLEDIFNPNLTIPLDIIKNMAQPIGASISNNNFNIATRHTVNATTSSISDFTYQKNKLIYGTKYQELSQIKNYFYSIYSRNRLSHIYDSFEDQFNKCLNPKLKFVANYTDVEVAEIRNCTKVFFNNLQRYIEINHLPRDYDIFDKYQIRLIAIFSVM